MLIAGVVTRLHDELYTRLPHGRLVLTGAGGAGKTGAMILLLLAALEHRLTVAPDQRGQVPVPVWLTMGGWNPHAQSLSEWASATMYRDHPYLRAPEFGPDAAAGLLNSGRVALFLDGLDEIAPEVRIRALQQVEAAAAGLRVVLTSRPEEYQQASACGRWHNVAEVMLRPVEPVTARAYLLADQHGAQRECWAQVGTFLLAQPDSVAARVLNTPLTLSLARDAYRHADPRVLTEFTDEQTLRGHLIKRSLTVAYPDERERNHATYWLGWITHHMGSDQRDVAWWQLSAWANQSRLRLTTILLVGTITIPILTLVTGLLFELVSGLAKSGQKPRNFRLRWPRPRELAGVLAVGLVVGLLQMLNELTRLPLPPPPQPAATPASAFRADQRVALLLGLAGGLASAVVDQASSAVLIAQIALRTQATGYVRFLPLLQDANRRQVLRQAGTVYQFRHAALQNYLAEAYRHLPRLPRDPS